MLRRLQRVDDILRLRKEKEMEKTNLITKLLAIQSELKAPKGQYNSFGKYKYRSCEDILEAVKPLCAKNGVALTLHDDVIQMGERFYVRATATLYDCETPDDITVTAYAREELEKKGQDGSQVTGTSSSYARKYALNGLFCIDDTKDADTDEYAAKTGKEKAPAKKAEAPTETMHKNRPNRDAVYNYAKKNNISVKELADTYHLNGNTTEERFAEVLKDLEGR